MYVAFDTFCTNDTVADIKYDLAEWSERYGVTYTQKTVKFTHRVCFEKPEDYVLFGLTWAPTHHCSTKFSIINIP